MGFRSGLRTVFSAGTPSSRAYAPSADDVMKAQKKRAKEEAARKERSRRHRFSVAQHGDDALIPLD